jgi:hypothetical protein
MNPSPLMGSGPLARQRRLGDVECAAVSQSISTGTFSPAESWWRWKYRYRRLGNTRAGSTGQNSDGDWPSHDAMRGARATESSWSFFHRIVHARSSLLSLVLLYSVNICLLVWLCVGEQSYCPARIHPYTYCPPPSHLSTPSTPSTTIYQFGCLPANTTVHCRALQLINRLVQLYADVPCSALADVVKHTIPSQRGTPAVRHAGRARQCVR